MSSEFINMLNKGIPKDVLKALEQFESRETRVEKKEERDPGPTSCPIWTSEHLTNPSQTSEYLPCHL